VIPQVIDVSENVLCVRRPSYLTCSYLIRRETGIVLIDAGMKTDGSDVLAGLAHWSCPISSVRAIFITHWHNDHSAGAAEIEARSGCAVYYAEAEAPQLTRATASVGLAGWLSDAIPEAGPLVLAKGLLGSAPMAAVEASAYLSEGDIVEGLVVMETPGHTVGHLSFWDPKERMLFAGDAFATIDGELRFMSRVVTENLDTARASMAKCARLDMRWACTGHREPMRVHSEHIRRFSDLIEAPDWPLLG
jgi:glyoxylase-like metal-dependent hydrolase (beta-lactamase superfamily II)